MVAEEEEEDTVKAGEEVVVAAVVVAVVGGQDAGEGMVEEVVPLTPILNKGLWKRVRGHGTRMTRDASGADPYS